MSLLDAPVAHRTEAAARPSARRGVVRWVLAVVMWLVILSCVLVISVAVLVPRVGGATPYTILTGSMSPGLPPGTLVVVKPVEPSGIAVGDVITYQLRSGESEVVTHRVVAVRSNLKGETEWQTQGDANNVADQRWVRPEQVRGELWYDVPHLGRVNTLLGGDQKQLAIYGAAAGLVLYAASMFVAGRRDRRRSA